MTTNFELFYSRIKKACNSDTDKGVADFLDLKKSTLSMWKKREKVDLELLTTKCEHVNLNWLIRGKGNMLISEETVVNSEEKLKSTKKEDDLKDQIIRYQKKLINALEDKTGNLKDRVNQLEFFMEAVKVKFQIENEIEKAKQETNVDPVNLPKAEGLERN